MSFDINSFDPRKNYVITASAGTGKTYNIVKIVEKLLQNGYALSDLLIVTFTEKAAGELKDRIRKCEGVNAAEVDNAAIGTIHSFCQKTIGEFCVTAGKSSGLKLVDEDACETYIRQFLRSGEVLRELCEEKEDGVDEKNLVKNLKALLSKYYLNSDGKEEETIAALYPSTDPLYQKLQREKSVDMQKFRPELKDCLRTLADSGEVKMQELAALLQDSKDMNFNGNKFRRPNNAAEEVKQAYDKITEAKNTAKTLKSVKRGELLAYKYIGGVWLGWQAEKAKRCEQTYDDMIRTVREELVRGDGALLEKLRGKYKYAIIDEFQDTNRLQWDIFKRIFLTEGHHITVVGDPKQSIYAFQGADVTVFNEAIKEIETKGGESCELCRNFRSTESMVECTGRFFSNSDVIDEFSPSECGEKRYAAEYDGKPTEPYWICKEYERTITTEYGKEVSKQAITEEVYARAVCKAIVDCCTAENEMTRLRVRDKREDGEFEERNVSFRDFALLAKTRSEMEIFEKTFEEFGIPFLRYKDNSLFESRECAHWIAVLEAVDAPDFSGKNREKLNKALYTLFFLNSLDAVADPKYKKDSIPEIGLFEKWRHAAADRRWEDLIDGILYDTDVEKKLGGLNDLKSLGVVWQIGSACLEHLSNGTSLTQLVKLLKRKNSGGDADEEKNEDAGLIAKSTDFDAVQIMTIHASKGLQFPVVIFSGAFKNRATNVDIYTYHKDGKRILSLSKRQENKDIVDKEEKAELQRLFYVAFTRAQFILMLPAFSNNSGVGAFLREPIRAWQPCHEFKEPDEPLEEMRRKVRAILNQNPAAPDTAAEKAQRERIRALIEGKKARNTYKFSYSNLSHMHVANEPLTAEDGAAPDNGEDEGTEEDTGLGRYDPNGKQIACGYDAAQEPLALSEKFPAGSKLGNALHTVFELADYRQDADTDDFADLARQCFKNEGFRVRDEWIDDVKNIARSVLNAKLPCIHGSAATGESFRLNELDFADRKNEAEFNFNKENEYLKRFFNGFIDLIFRRGDYYSVLDWKSDRLNEDFTSYADGAELKKHVDELYAIQRVLYSYCLIKWLGNFYPDLTEQEIFERHYGGIYYIFLRGCADGTGNGVYAQTWENYDALDAAYHNIVRERVERNVLPESL